MKDESVKKSLEKSKNVLEDKRKNGQANTFAISYSGPVNYFTLPFAISKRERSKEYRRSTSSLIHFKFNDAFRNAVTMERKTYSNVLVSVGQLIVSLLAQFVTAKGFTSPQSFPRGRKVIIL